MTSPSAEPTGSSLFRPIPVDLRRACPSMSPAIFPVSALTPCRRIPSHQENQPRTPVSKRFLPSHEHSNLPQLPWLPQLASNQRRTRSADGALRNRWVSRRGALTCPRCPPKIGRHGESFLHDRPDHLALPHR